MSKNVAFWFMGMVTTALLGNHCIAQEPNAGSRDTEVTCDLAVIGGTPCGMACAVRAAREGLSVVLVNRTEHLGGMLSSGLGVWDAQYEGHRSPIYDELRAGLMEYYRTTYGDDSPQYRDARPGKSGYTNGRFEPHVAEKLITRMVAQERNIRVLKGYASAAVDRDGALLKSLVLRPVKGDRELTVTARVFADCLVEGDVMALAGVSYRVGRESRDEFGEPHAGIIFMRPTSIPPNPEAEKLAALHDQLNLRKFTGWQVRLPQSTGAAREPDMTCRM